MCVCEGGGVLGMNNACVFYFAEANIINKYIGESLIFSPLSSSERILKMKIIISNVLSSSHKTAYRGTRQRRGISRREEARSSEIMRNRLNNRHRYSHLGAGKALKPMRGEISAALL